MLEIRMSYSKPAAQGLRLSTSFLDLPNAFYIICLICEVIFFLLDKTENSGQGMFDVSK
jgi:hypothetical protein